MTSLLLLCLFYFISKSTLLSNNLSNNVLLSSVTARLIARLQGCQIFFGHSAKMRKKFKSATYSAMILNYFLDQRTSVANSLELKSATFLDFIK